MNTNIPKITQIYLTKGTTVPPSIPIMSESQIDATTCTPQHPEGILLTSTLFGRMKGDEPEGAYIKGGKTGFTSQAGNCIASFGVSENGTEYIFVTTKAKGLWKAVYDHIDVYTAYAK